MSDKRVGVLESRSYSRSNDVFGGDLNCFMVINSRYARFGRDLKTSNLNVCSCVGSALTV